MKNKFLRLLSTCLIALMLLPMAFMGVSADSGNEYVPSSIEPIEKGATFGSGNTTKMENILPSLPYTYEAEIQINTTNRGGVILGNYSGSGKCISFEISNNGNPRIYAASGNDAVSTIFADVSILSTEFVRLSITVDAKNNMAHCYVNGEPKQSLAFNYSKIANTIPTERPLMVGGDFRSGNSTPFLGQIKSVYAYSDMRTSEEIAQGTDLNDDNLLVAYDFMSAGSKNLSKHNGYDLTTNNLSILAVDYDYLTVNSKNSYQVMKSFNKPILTYELTALIPKNLSGNSRGGTVLGNYYSGTNSANCVNFEFKDNFSPRVYYEINGSQYDFHFSNVDARSDELVNVTITIDPETGTGCCYINGELKQKIVKGKFTLPEQVYSTPMYLGRDTRTSYPFRGAIKNLAVYSDVRTVDEIKADMAAFNSASDDLLAMYEFDKETGRSDISGNCYHICYKGETRPEDTSTPDIPDTPDTPDTPDAPTALDGLTFTSSDFAVVRKSFKNNAPYTFEATILIEEGFTGRAGIILGNHHTNSYKYLSFEIRENGVPRLCFTNPTNLNDVDSFDYRFSTVHVNTGKAVHLAITLDPTTGTAICYVNGEEKESISRGATKLINEHFENYYHVLGNDPRTGDTQYFKGIIGSVALYSDIRTADEIKLDYQGVNLEDENIILYYDLSNATSGNDIEDLTGNGYNIKYGEKSTATVSPWIAPNDKEEVKDYLYSFAVVGDTQIIANRYGSSFGKIYDWILNNQATKKIAHVFGLGDITDGNSANEWALAKTHILEKLTGVIPYSVVRGNHDGISQINSIFATEAYMSQFDGFYKENDITNSYRYFEIADTKYLFITLDYGANDDILNWAGEIIKANPDRKVIITTHAYLFRDGTTLDSGDTCPPTTSGGYNNGDHMWDKLISKYENIYLVMSGHDPYANVVVKQTEGVNGNIVTQILTDHQGVDTSTPTGMVTMLYFMADGSIEVETYSTIQEAYYKENNQFVIEETEHSYTENVSYAYANGYLQNGVFSATCVHCDKRITKDLKPIIVFHGYSIKEDNTAMCVDYSVNYDLLNAYESANGKSIILGVVACGYDNLVNKDGKPINADGSVAEVTSGRVVSNVIENELESVSLIMRTTDWSKYANLNTILCMYIIDENGVSYACGEENATASAISVTYNAILSGQSNEGGNDNE